MSIYLSNDNKNLCAKSFKILTSSMTNTTVVENCAYTDGSQIEQFFVLFLKNTHYFE